MPSKPQANSAERRLDNIKKALRESERSARNGTKEDVGLQELFKGIDAAKTLRQLLRNVGTKAARRNNRAEFVDFIALEVPAIKGAPRSYCAPGERLVQPPLNMGDVIYELRCAVIHDKENRKGA